MKDKIKSIIKVLFDDIVTGSKTDENNPISLAASRLFGVDVCTALIGNPGIIGLLRKDNMNYGYCLGYLPFEAYEWLNLFSTDEICPPFSFQFEHHDIDLAKPKES